MSRRTRDHVGVCYPRKVRDRYLPRHLKSTESTDKYSTSEQVSAMTGTLRYLHMLNILNIEVSTHVKHAKHWYLHSTWMLNIFLNNNYFTVRGGVSTQLSFTYLYPVKYQTNWTIRRQQLIHNLIYTF